MSAPLETAYALDLDAVVNNQHQKPKQPYFNVAFGSTIGTTRKNRWSLPAIVAANFGSQSEHQVHQVHQSEQRNCQCQRSNHGILAMKGVLAFWSTNSTSIQQNSAGLQVGHWWHLGNWKTRIMKTEKNRPAEGVYMETPRSPSPLLVRVCADFPLMLETYPKGQILQVVLDVAGNAFCCHFYLNRS